MRLLVLDESRILVSVVRRVAPSYVEVETAASFEAAWELLRHHAPDAVIANLGANHLPWDSLRTFCQKHQPPIPVLFESCVHRTPGEAGLGPLDQSAAFLRRPCPLDDLKAQIDRLLRSAHGAADDIGPGTADDDLAVEPDPPPKIEPL